MTAKKKVAKVKKSVATVEVVEKPVHLTLVLNGGSEVMDNSTIPVRWFFSKELAERGPKYLVIADQTENEFDLPNNGRRYVVKVDESVKFIQLHRAGKHRVSVLALDNHNDALEYLVRDSRNTFKMEIYHNLIKRDGFLNGSLAANFMDFIVPDGLFAKEPTSKLGKLFFSYLLWPRKKMVDECDMRKQVILAIPKLLVFVLWYALKITGFVLYMIYMIIAPIALFFVGFSPISCSHWWRMIKDLVISGELYDCLEVRANGSQIKYLQLYHQNPNKEGYHYEYVKTKRMFISPMLLLFGLATLVTSVIITPHIFEVNGNMMLSFCFLLLFFAVILDLIITPRFVDDVLTTGIIIGLSFFIVCFILFWVFVILNFNSIESDTIGGGIRKFIFVISAIAVVIFIILRFINIKEKTQEAKTIKKQDEERSEEERYKEYLLQNYTIPESKVNLDTIPTTFDKNNTVKKFRVSFWTLKAKICRPYQN